MFRNKLSATYKIFRSISEGNEIKMPRNWRKITGFKWPEIESSVEENDDQF